MADNRKQLVIQFVVPDHDALVVAVGLYLMAGLKLLVEVAWWFRQAPEVLGCTSVDK